MADVPGLLKIPDVEVKAPTGRPPFQRPSLRAIHASYSRPWKATGYRPRFIDTWNDVARHLADGPLPDRWLNARPGQAAKATPEGQAREAELRAQLRMGLMPGKWPNLCSGMKHPGNRHKKPALCGKTVFCNYCWERRAYWSGMKAGCIHASSPTVTKFSTTLVELRQDPDAFLQYRKNAWDWLRQLAGYRLATINIHVYGENPAEGVKLHLDGIVSGGDDADATVFAEGGRFEDYTRSWFDKYARNHPKYERLEGSRIRTSSHATAIGLGAAWFNDLILAGMYSGRQTFPTPRVRAGLYGRHGDYRVRLTNMHRTRKLADLQDHRNVEGHVTPDWSHAQLVGIQAEAIRLWDHVGYPLHSRDVKVEEDRLEAILAASRWRHRYRLDGDDALRGQYGSGARPVVGAPEWTPAQRRAAEFLFGEAV